MWCKLYLFIMITPDNTHDISHNNWPSEARPQDSPRHELVLLVAACSWPKAGDRKVAQGISFDVIIRHYL